MKHFPNSNQFFEKLIDSVREIIHLETQISIGITPIVKEKFQSRDTAYLFLKIALPILFHWAMVRKIKAFKLAGHVFKNNSHVEAVIEELNTLKYRSPP